MISASRLHIAWRKSSYSSTNGGNCIEVGESLNGPIRPEWRKSSYSSNNGGACVEIGDTFNNLIRSAWTESIPVRDSKRPQGPALTVPTPAWQAFIAWSRTRSNVGSLAAAAE